MSPKNIKRVVLGIALMFFVFTLFHATWIAPKPSGNPKLLAANPVDIPRDDSGCLTEANSGYGAVPLAPETRMLQSAVGNEADAILIDSEIISGEAVQLRQLKFDCAQDAARPRATLVEALVKVSKPIQYIAVHNAGHAAAILRVLPQDKLSRIFFGESKGVAAIKAAMPNAKGFAIRDARACASGYRSSGWYGAVPEICRNGTMLLSLDDLGYSLWGWPNRFLDRMKEANTDIIIAQSVDGDKITGLSSIEQYGEIAGSFNGTIWVDNISDLGPALRR